MRRLSLLVALVGCPSDDPPPGGSSEAGSSQPTGTEDDDENDSGTTEAPVTSTTQEPTTLTDPTNPTEGSESGPTGGCTSTADCAGGQYCDFADDSCGVSGMEGTCVDAPANCDDESRPVCGCDDALHANICDAAGAGQDVAFLGVCDVPNGAFRCGFSFCISGDEYCQEQAGAMPTGECVTLPPVCVPPDCSCITNCCGCDNASCCSEFCTNNDGDLRYVCP